MATVDPGTLSDEEFEKHLINGDTFAIPEEEEQKEDTTDTVDNDEVESKSEENNSDIDQNTTEETKKEESSVDNPDTSDDLPDNAGKEPSDDQKATSTDNAEDTEPDYKAIHEKIFTPFKASGKLVTVKTPEEAIQLMQKGVHFNSEMQKLAPQKRIIAMLQNHELLDEGKLSNLISLSKKDPAAIKQLIKESGIDPLDIDTLPDQTAPANYSVSDKQVAWQNALDEYKSFEAGQETLKDISTNWDDQSIQVLSSNPEFLQRIHEQRETGVYQMIVAEMDRLRAVGQLPATAPFLQGYKTVGDMLEASGGFASLVPAPKNTSPQTRKPVASRPASVPKAVGDSGAKAAASTRTTTSRSGAHLVDFANVSDADLDQFL